MAYYCNTCGGVFEDSNYDNQCPYCGSYQYDEARTCECCDETKSYEDMFSSEVCLDCARSFYREFRFWNKKAKESQDFVTISHKGKKFTVSCLIDSLFTEDEIKKIIDTTNGDPEEALLTALENDESKSCWKYMEYDRDWTEDMMVHCDI